MKQNNHYFNYQSMTRDSVLFLQFPTLQQMVNIDFNLDRICRIFNISLFISSLYIEDDLGFWSLEFTLQSLISCLTVVFVFLFNVTVWYKPHFPSIAERMVSISVPSCRGWEQASISYQNPSWVSLDPYLWQPRSERLLPARFVRSVPGPSYRLRWHVPKWTLTLLNWNCCEQPHRKSCSEPVASERVKQQPKAYLYLEKNKC